MAHTHKYREVDAKEFSPGDVVKVLSIENRGEFIFGMRYAVVLGPATKMIKDTEHDGYEILVGARIEWHSTKALFLSRHDVDN